MTFHVLVLLNHHNTETGAIIVISQMRKPRHKDQSGQAYTVMPQVVEAGFKVSLFNPSTGLFSYWTFLTHCFLINKISLTIDQVCYLHIMEYYAALKSDKVQRGATPQGSHTTIMQSENSKAQYIYIFF
uniref:Uncharacterized protein n=1 Tax=Myotis myotis TaxID=51298 RepID=A0A7J7SC44_MYOMY|nr:hypothetical protein mMyoMyo1_009536 [Myotis myotis]